MLRPHFPGLNGLLELFETLLWEGWADFCPCKTCLLEIPMCFPKNRPCLVAHTRTPFRPWPTCDELARGCGGITAAGGVTPIRKGSENIHMSQGKKDWMAAAGSGINGAGAALALSVSELPRHQQIKANTRNRALAPPANQKEPFPHHIALFPRTTNAVITRSYHDEAPLCYHAPRRLRLGQGSQPRRRRL